LREAWEREILKRRRGRAGLPILLIRAQVVSFHVAPSLYGLVIRGPCAAGGYGRSVGEREEEELRGSEASGGLRKIITLQRSRGGGWRRWVGWVGKGGRGG